MGLKEIHSAVEDLGGGFDILQILPVDATSCTMDNILFFLYRNELRVVDNASNIDYVFCSNCSLSIIYTITISRSFYHANIPQRVSIHIGIFLDPMITEVMYQN